MNCSYRNRFGKLWRLLRKMTPSGKNKYYFSQRPGGDPASELPSGYEVFENAEGQVFLRKAGTAEIQQSEVDRVAACLRWHGKADGFEAWPAKNTVTVYEISQVMADLSQHYGLHLSPDRIRQANYERGGRTLLLRFVLADKNQRTFRAQRYCFRGSVDDWIDLTGPDKLERLCEKFIPHLGRDSFFELSGL